MLSALHVQAACRHRTHCSAPARSAGRAWAVCGQGGQQCPGSVRAGWAVRGQGARGSALAGHQEQDVQAAALATCRDRQRVGSARAVLRATRVGCALAGPCVWAARSRAQAAYPVPWQCGQYAGSARRGYGAGRALQCTSSVGCGGGGPHPSPHSPHVAHAGGDPAPGTLRGSLRQRGRPRPSSSCCRSPALTAGAACGAVPGARAGPTAGGSRPLRGHRPLCKRCRPVSHPRGDTVWAPRVGRLVPAESGQRWGRAGHPMPINRELGEQRGCKILSLRRGVGVRGWWVCEHDGTGSTVGPSWLCPPRWAEGFCGFVRALLSLHCHRAPAPHTASPCTHAVLTHAVLAEEE